MNKEHLQSYIPKNAETAWSETSVAFEVSAAHLKEVILELSQERGLSLKLLTATDEREEDGCFKVWYVFGVPDEHAYVIPYLRLKDTTEFPSMAAVMQGVSNYERKIQTFFGLTPVGNPDKRPIILQENWPADAFPLRKDFDWNARPEAAYRKYAFQKVRGEGIYEIPVGPIHAGIIEPGHFRFSVAGERIVLLEPQLGFVHKGSEKLFEILKLDEKVRLSEKISGDSSFSHSLAFCQALEQLSGTSVPKRGQYLRVLYAELERLANHFGDIGAIMIDTGFNFGGAQGARLREMVMRLNEQLTGSRFLRGVNAIGGVMKDISDAEREVLSRELEALRKDFSEIIAIAENDTSLQNRLKGTGVLSPEIAREYGVVGVAGRAAGIAHDIRAEYPYAAYQEVFSDEIPTEKDGDVHARFQVRIKEAYATMEMIQKVLQDLPEGPTHASAQKVVFAKNSFAVSAVEGWRGEIVYLVTTDAKGNISRVAPRDPSFVNWGALKHAGFDNVVPDFPLINKSFNLSYSGNDL